MLLFSSRKAQLSVFEQPKCAGAAAIFLSAKIDLVFMILELKIRSSDDLKKPVNKYNNDCSKRH